MCYHYTKLSALTPLFCACATFQLRAPPNLTEPRIVAVQEFPTYLTESLFNMFIVPCIIYVRVKLLNFLLRNGCMYVRHNSHTAALLCRKGSIYRYSQLKLQYKNQNSCHPRCIPPHVSRLVTSAVIKDGHKYANPDTSDDKKADSSNLKHHGILKTYHTPVMVKEVLEALQPVNGQV